MLNLVEKYSAEAAAETEDGVVAIEYVLMAGLVAVGVALAFDTGLWTEMKAKLNGVFTEHLVSGRGSASCPVPDKDIMRNSHQHPQRRDDQGVVALEFVLVAPFLIALIFAIASFGLFFSKKVDVTSTARDAARTLALRGTPTYPAGVTASAVATCPPGNTTSNASVTLTSQLHVLHPVHPARHQDDHSDRDHAMRRLKPTRRSRRRHAHRGTDRPCPHSLRHVRVRRRSRHRCPTPDTERCRRRCPGQGDRLCKGRHDDRLHPLPERWRCPGEHAGLRERDHDSLDETRHHVCVPTGHRSMGT